MIEDGIMEKEGGDQEGEVVTMVIERTICLVTLVEMILITIRASLTTIMIGAILVISGTEVDFDCSLLQQAGLQRNISCKINILVRQCLGSVQNYFQTYLANHWF